MPLAFYVSGANRHDSIMFEPLVDALPTPGDKPSRARRWPEKLHADKAYDIERCHRHLRTRGIADRIARKAVDSKQRPGQPRWVVERTYAWLAGMGKLRIRFERSLDTHRALLSLACNIICLRSLDNKKPAL